LISRLFSAQIGDVFLLYDTKILMKLQFNIIHIKNFLVRNNGILNNDVNLSIYIYIYTYIYVCVCVCQHQKFMININNNIDNITLLKNRLNSLLKK